MKMCVPYLLMTSTAQTMSTAAAATHNIMAAETSSAKLRPKR